MSRTGTKSSDDFKLRKPHSPASCFLPLLLIPPFSLSGLLGTICWNSCSEEQGNRYPSFLFAPQQKRKQLKRNLLDCLCLCYLVDGFQAVMIITHCWIITQNLGATRSYLSVCRWGRLSGGGAAAATDDGAWEHEPFYSQPQILCIL